jgi:hypothetical protein
MNTPESKNRIEVAAKILVAELVTIAQESGRRQFADEDLPLLKGLLRYMTDDELVLFGGAGYLTSQAVADFLESRIAKLGYNDRIQLGKKMNYWRVWKKIISVPGLNWDEVHQIQREYDCGVGD